MFRPDAFRPGWWRDPREARRSRGVEQAPLAFVSPEGAPTVARARSAGIVAVSEIATMPALPAQADFATDTWGNAFWFVRAPDVPDGAGTMYFSAGSRILRDLRGELNITTGDAVWSEGVLRRLGALASSLGVTPPSELPTSGALPSAWLRLALWFTYERDSFPRQVEAVRLPTLRTLPMLGASLGVGSQPTRAVNNLDPATLAVNPFGPVQAPVIDVEGDPGTTTTTTTRESSSGGGWLLALGALALMLGGGKR